MDTKTKNEILKKLLLKAKENYRHLQEDKQNKTDDNNADKILNSI